MPGESASTTSPRTKHASWDAYVRCTFTRNRTGLEGGELEVRQVFPKLGIRGRFLELAIAFRCIELDVSVCRKWHTMTGPVKPAASTMACTTSRMLTSSSSPTGQSAREHNVNTREDDRIDLLIFTKYPDE